MGKIEKFFSELDEEDRIHLENLRAITKQIRFIYDRMDCTYFAELFKLSDFNIYNFRDGNYDYTMRDIARVQAAYIKFKTEDNIKQD